MAGDMREARLRKARRARAAAWKSRRACVATARNTKASNVLRATNAAARAAVAQKNTDAKNAAPAALARDAPATTNARFVCVSCSLCGEVHILCDVYITPTFLFAFSPELGVYGNHFVLAQMGDKSVNR